MKDVERNQIFIAVVVGCGVFGVFVCQNLPPDLSVSAKFVLGLH